MYELNWRFTFVSLPEEWFDINHNSVFPQIVPVSDLPERPSPGSPFVYTLTRLIGGTNYTFWMTSNTSQGDGGVQSEPFSLLLPEDGQSDTQSTSIETIY